ncbi:MAG: hypothetical protein AAFY91_17350, partial [Bacteroidota bacterium]
MKYSILIAALAVISSFHPISSQNCPNSYLAKEPFIHDFDRTIGINRFTSRAVQAKNLIQLFGLDNH